MKTKNCYSLLVFVVILVAVCRGCDTAKTKVETITKVDTIVVHSPEVHDTIKIDRVVRIPAEFVDITEDDSVYITSVEQRHYMDSTYEAWVSGVEPQLDSIRVFSKHTIKTITKEVPVFKFLPALPEKSVRFGGFISATSSFDLNHINLQGGAELSIKNFGIKAGYNVGDYNYPFLGLEYKIR